jgi:hypothetical protein
LFLLEHIVYMLRCTKCLGSLLLLGHFLFQQA